MNSKTPAPHCTAWPRRLHCVKGATGLVVARTLKLAPGVLSPKDNWKLGAVTAAVGSEPVDAGFVCALPPDQKVADTRGGSAEP